METDSTLPGILGLAAADSEREELLGAISQWLAQCRLQEEVADPVTRFFRFDSRGRVLHGVVHVVEPGLWTFASYLLDFDDVLSGSQPMHALAAHCQRLEQEQRRA